jgi:thiamine biosynthesis lipoprotein ApbE
LRSLSCRLAAVALALGLAAPAGAAELFTRFREDVLGTTLELRILADDGAAADRAEVAVLAEVSRLARIASSYDPASELMRWQGRRGAMQPASAELLGLLQAADGWRERSGGAFEPRVQALTALWSRCAAAGRTPTDAERAAVTSRFVDAPWRLDAAAGTAACLTDLPLSFNAIAKGDIVDRACAAALDPARGVRGLMVALGGDLRVRGELARPVGIADPRRDSESDPALEEVLLNDRALATSGGSQRGWTIAGRRYSHLLDPRTGRPTGATRGATVLAPTCRDADALATVLCVLPPERGLALVETLPDFACLIVGDDGRVLRSTTWPGRAPAEARPPLALAAFTPPAPAAQGAWNPAYELLVRFEINAPPGAGFGYRRPYVAVWVEDAEGVPVRTLVLWMMKGGPGPRWLPDLRRWYRGDQVRKLVDDADLVATVAKATRPPGTYSVAWDGKDDAGKAVAAGTYTLAIEAAREHGTYQVIRQELTLGETPFAQELKGNVEIKSASVEYRRRAGQPAAR